MYRWKLWHLNNFIYDGYPIGTRWHIDSDSEEPMTIYLRPSVVLRSPTVAIKSVRLGLYAEPGLELTLPYAYANIDVVDANGYEVRLKHASTWKGKWLSASARLGIFLQAGVCEFSAGYMISNQSVYGGYRKLEYDGVSFDRFYPDNKIVHGAFLSMSYHF